MSVGPKRSIRQASASTHLSSNAQLSLLPEGAVSLGQHCTVFHVASEQAAEARATVPLWKTRKRCFGGWMSGICSSNGRSGLLFSADTQTLQIRRAETEELWACMQLTETSKATGFMCGPPGSLCLTWWPVPCQYS